MYGRSPIRNFPSLNFIQTKSVKIIRDRDDKPKGFGYIEFVDLTALKDALAKTGSVSPLLYELFQC